MKEEFTEEKKYAQWLTVPCYQTDQSFCLKPASFMDMMQELAYRAAKVLGFGYEALNVHGIAWVLSRMHFHFYEPARWRDEVKLETWHKGQDGLFFLRDFNLSGEDGKRLAACTSSWLVLRTDTRHLVRPNELLDLVSPETQCHDDALPEPCGKIVMPKDVEVEKVASHCVGYSDVDIIGHTNNASYIVWAMDAIPASETFRHRVTDVQVNFNKETRPGETVDICLAREGSAYYVEGVADGRPSFICRIEFEDV